MSGVLDHDPPEHSADPGDSYDAPERVAADVLHLARPGVLVFDCDGVLAPITAHADDSVLLDGVGDLLDRLGDLTARRGLSVAVLSGRSLAGLDQFHFPDSLDVLGSYGGERRGRPPLELTGEESRRLDVLRDAAELAATAAGHGAWVELKPGSVVLHVRQADPTRGAEALRSLERTQAEVDGSSIHHGSEVVELLARPNDKGTALGTVRTETGARSVVYLGDDVPDEDAFDTLLAGDLGIKVGPGPTAASRRLADPGAVRDLLRALVEQLAAGPP